MAVSLRQIDPGTKSLITSASFTLRHAIISLIVALVAVFK
jgi:hypothetical protein